MRVRIGLSRDIVCRQAVELATDYLEDALTRGERRRFEAHLVKCPYCREYLVQMRATIELTGTISPGDLTPHMQDEFIDIFRRWQSESDPAE
jgi:predicted anti-sigma-YlaC factor YlaD